LSARLGKLKVEVSVVFAKNARGAAIAPFRTTLPDIAPTFPAKNCPVTP